MIEKIIEFSAKNKYIVIIFTLVAIVAAVYCKCLTAALPALSLVPLASSAAACRRE